MARDRRLAKALFRREPWPAAESWFEDAIALGGPTGELRAWDLGLPLSPSSEEVFWVSQAS